MTDLVSSLTNVISSFQSQLRDLVHNGKIEVSIGLSRSLKLAIAIFITFLAAIFLALLALLLQGRYLTPWIIIILAIIIGVIVYFVL